MLTECIDGDSPPPHSVSTLFYGFEMAHQLKWQGYEGLKAVPAKSQLYRTLQGLIKQGMVMMTKEKQEPMDNGLPYWENQYQLAADETKNSLARECLEVHRLVTKAKIGTRLFDAVFDQGMAADQVKPLSLRVKSMMQRTHPDKMPGLEYEFKQMQECHKLIKSGIPLPQTTHSAHEGGRIAKSVTNNG